MPYPIRLYVYYVEAFNRTVGRITMYLVFAMMGILLFLSLTKVLPQVFDPPLWGIEMAQFVMAAYYLLGGAYSMQTDSHVRMDLLYGRWSPRTRACVDAVTTLFLLTYLVILLLGGISSTQYALQYGEESYSSWAPKMAPIKVIMVIGIVLMLLQSVAVFFRDLAAAMEKPLP